MKQWTAAYIIGSALAGVTLFCTSFGEFIWKGSLTWVRLSRVLAASSNVCTAACFTRPLHLGQSQKGNRMPITSVY